MKLFEVFAEIGLKSKDFLSGLVEMESAAVSTMQSIQSETANAGRAISDFLNRSEGNRVGREFADGLTQGIEGGGRRGPLAAVQNLGRSVLNGLNNIFGINSPSREGIEIGEYLGDGIAAGIALSIDKGIHAARKYSDMVKREFSGDLASNVFVATQTHRVGLSDTLEGSSNNYNITVENMEVRAEDVESRDDFVDLFTGLKEAMTARSGIRRGV